MSDEVIEQAARRLPPEIYEMSGAKLEASLRARRDRLDRAVDGFYRQLSDKVDIQGTDVDEVVTVDRTERGAVLVTIAESGDTRNPYFSRRFVRSETSEIRLHLHGGDDSVAVLGDAETEVLVRLIGGGGDDRFDFDGDARGVRVYDHEGRNELVATDEPHFSPKPYEEWVWTQEDRHQPQDWGSWLYPIFWSSYSSDVGPFIGGGVRLETYGFRTQPYASRWNLRGGYAPSVGKGRIEVDARLNTENSGIFWTLGARLSRLDVLHYFGLGNQSPAGNRDFHRVDLTSASASLGLGWSLSPRFEGSLGVRFDRSSTQVRRQSYFETLGPLYGGGVFYQVGVGADLVVDPLGEDRSTGNRFRLKLHGTAFPPALDVDRTFGRLGGEVSTLLASSRWPDVSMATRVGGEQVYGRFPWHEAAYLGGTTTVRGFTEQRFAGDAALYASGELRVQVWRPRVVVPSALGVFGFIDAGRVYVDGDSPGGWWTSAGGGLYFQPVRQPYIVRLGAGSSEEGTKVFLVLGLPY